MQFTTHKQQQKEYNHMIKEERRTLVRHVLMTLFEYFCACLMVLAPALALALGWITG